MAVDLQQQALHVTLNAAHMAKDLFLKAAADERLDLTFPQLAVLLSLPETPILIKDCGGRAGIDRSTVSAIVWRLSVRGLVTIRNEANGRITRACLISITEKGARLRQHGENILSRLDKAYLEEVGDAGAQALLMRQLAQIIEHHTAQRGDASLEQ